MVDQTIRIIEQYLASKRLSREQLAAQTGVSLSTLNKILGGQIAASNRALLKISSKTGVSFEIKKPSFDLELHECKRQDVAHLEGSYQTLRPSFRDEDGIQCFETLIFWDEVGSHLRFKEIDNDLSPGNAGLVSIPFYQRIIYLLSSKAGNFRLAALSNAYEPGVFYGGLLTVASPSLSTKAPACTYFILKKSATPQEIVRGMITFEHQSHGKFSKLLSFAKNEGFFRIFDWEKTPDQLASKLKSIK